MSASPQGLVYAIMTAYNNHVDLVIRPDDVWLTILAQFCAHVNKHAEALRGKIVDHEGKIQLEVSSTGGLLTADYTYFITAMLEMIRANIKSPELADWFYPGFSTTTRNDEVSAAATAMATLQSYFEYKFTILCGIPSVTLMGTVDDWKLLREKIERLLDFEVEDNPEGHVMERWVGYLRKVTDGFVESAEHPESAETLEFWDKVLSHVGGGSGPSYITGWLSALTCFDKDGNFMGNSVQASREFPLIDTSEINHNVVSCPVTIEDNGVEYKATLFSGQVALDARDAVEGERAFPTIRPRTDWCLAVEEPDAAVEGTGVVEE
ncbi:unnamed protein product [Scytosiphon promiscuus]